MLLREMSFCSCLFSFLASPFYPPLSRDLDFISDFKKSTKIVDWISLHHQNLSDILNMLLFRRGLHKTMLYDNVYAGNVGESCWNVVLCSVLYICRVKKFGTLWHIWALWQTVIWNNSPPPHTHTHTRTHTHTHTHTLRKKLEQNIFQNVNYTLDTYKQIYDKFKDLTWKLWKPLLYWLF